MSTTYRTGDVPDSADALIAFLREELSRLQQALNGAQPFAEIQVAHAEPKKLRAGIVAYADGADWNPGSGEGLYRRDKANANWVYIG